MTTHLVLQTELCQGAQQQVGSGIDGSASHKPLVLFEQCWRAFLECEWEHLDALIKELSSKTRVDASEYLPLFSLLHASRPFRPQTDDQTVSLSRRFYGMSRQPAQVFHSFRSHRNAVNALLLKLQSDPHPGAIDRWQCLVLSMLEQLSALRSWDFGRWLQAVAQQGDYHLELARFGNPDHAKRGVMCSVLSLRHPQKGKDSWYDDAILLLDHLTAEERSELVRWLLARRPVEWRGAHRVLEELADSIPEDQVVEVARWTVQLSLSKKALSGWSLTYLNFWSSILPYSERTRQIVEVLLPAILRDAAIPVCWVETTESLILSIREASLPDAKKVIERMIGLNVQANSPESIERWHVIFNACLRRSQLFDTYKRWLIEQPEFNPINSYMIARVERTQNWNLSPEDLQMAPENNKEMRDWIRQQMLTYCDKILPEQGRQSMVQMSLPPKLILWVTWPDDESELVESSVKAVDMPEALVSTKTGPLQALAFLTLRLPEVTANRICDQAVRWLYAGVPGREITIGGPHSIAQFRGADYGSVFPAVLFLADLALYRAPSRVGDPVANWLLQHGLRQPARLRTGYS